MGQWLDRKLKELHVTENAEAPFRQRSMSDVTTTRSREQEEAGRTSSSSTSVGTSAQQQTVPRALDVAETLFGAARDLTSDRLSTERRRTESLLEAYGGVRDAQPSPAAQVFGTPNARRTTASNILSEELSRVPSVSDAERTSLEDELGRLALQRADEIQMAGRDRYENDELDARIAEIQSQLGGEDAAYEEAARRLSELTGTQVNRTILDDTTELEQLESVVTSDPLFAQRARIGRTSEDNARTRLTTGVSDEYINSLAETSPNDYEAYDEAFRRRIEAGERGAKAGNAIASDTDVFEQMDEFQRTVYDYYVGIGEPETAERYLDLIRPQLNYQIGEQLAAERNEWSDWDPRNLGLSTLSGLESSLGGIRNAARAVTGNDLLPQSSLATSQGLREYDSTVGQVANDLLNTTGYMVPAYAFGGTVGNVVLGVSSAGNAYQEAVNSGEDETAAVGYAILSGMTESATNALFGGIERLGTATNLTGRISGAVQGAIRKLIQNPTARAAMSTLSRYLSSAAGEGAEEFLQEYIDAGLNAVFFGTEYDGELFSDALYSALLGGLNAAVLNAPTLPSTFQQERMSEDFRRVADYLEANLAREQGDGQTEAESEPDTMTVGEAREAAQVARAEAAAQPETAAQDPLRAVAEEVAAEQMAQQEAAQEAEISTQAVARTMAEERAAREAQTAQAAAQTPAQQAVQETQTQAAQVPAETVGAGEARPVETPQAAARESALQGVRDAARIGLDYEQATSGMAAQTLLTAEEREQAWTEGYRDTQAGLNYRTSRNAVRNAVEQRLRSEGNYSAENLREAYSLARTQLRLLDDLGKEYGVKITVVDSIPANGRTSGADAAFDPATGEIHIAADVSAGAYLAVGAHELTHYIKGFNDGGYRILEDTVLAALRTGGTDVDALISAELARFSSVDVERWGEERAQAAALEEVVANAIPAVFAQQETVERIARTDTSLARRIADFFRRLADKLRGLLDGLTRSQRKFAAAQELAQMEEQIGEISDRFFDALGDASANAERRTEQDARGVRRLSRRSPEALSIKEQIALRQDDLNGMEPVIEIQSEVRPRRNGKPDRTLVRKALQNYYGSLKYSVERRGFGTVQFDENALSEMCHYIDSDAEFAAAKAAPAVIKRGILVDHHMDHKGRTTVESFTFAAPVELNGKRGNEAVVVQRTNRNKPHCVRILMPDGSTFDLDAKKGSSQDRSRGISENASEQLIGSASTSSIAEQEEERKLSAREAATDSEGNALSAQQAEFFKNSRVRNEDGELLPVYHATYNDFTVFDRSRLGENTEGNATNEGFERTAKLGFWFNTRDLSKDSFGTRSEKVYLNIANPMEYDSLEALAGALREVDSETLLQRLRAEGYDGIVLRDEEFGGTSYVAFDPNQIKRTTNEAPSASPDIRFSLRDPQNLVEMIETDPDVLNGQVQRLNEQVRAQAADLQAYSRTAAALSSTVKRLREELRLTRGRQADRTAARRKANALKKTWKSGVDTAALTEDLASAWESLLEMTASGMDDADVGAALNAGVTQIAESILQGNIHRDTQVYEDAAELRAYLRGTTISFNEGQLGEIRSKYGSLQSYRNSLMGKVKLSQNSENTIDSMWGELCDLFPEFFDRETPEGDQPARLYEVAQHIYNRPLANLDGMTDDEARNAIVLDVMEAVLDMTPRETFADRQRAKLDAAKQRLRQLKKELAAQAAEARRTERQAARAANREKRQALSEQYKQLKSEEAQAVKQEQRQQIQERQRALREQYAELSAEKRAALKNQRERMEERQRAERYRKNIQRTANELYNWVMRPTRDKHVPEALRNATIEFLQTLDFTSGQGPSKRSEAWREKLVNLSAAIRANGADGNLFADADPNLLPNIEELLQRGKGAARVWQMSAADLEILDRIVAAAKHQITTANELFQNELRQSAAELGEMAIEELNSRKEARVYNRGPRASLQRFLNWDLIDANTAGHVMGSAVHSVVQELRNGFDVKIGDIDQAKTFAEETFDAYKKETKKDIRREAEELHALDIGGQKVELTTGEIMKLYTLSKRAQALPHLYEGGFRTTRSDNRGRRMNRPVRLNEESLNRIINVLTPAQKRVADELQRFQSTTMADWGNEASLQRFGYRIFTEEFYSSINSDSNFLTSSGNEIDEGGNINAGYYALANLGMTKQTQPNANNPVTVPDIFADFFRHVDQMSAYHAYLVPLADAMRVFNYKAADDSGRRSVRQSMDIAFGPQGWQYLSRLIKRLNGMDQPVRGSGLMRNARVASVAANLSVVVQQPTAIIRAASILDGKYVAAAIATAIPTLRKYRNLAQQYAPIAKWKSWGFIDAGLGPSLRSVVMGDADIRERIQNAATAPAGAADDFTWGAIFHACVMQVKADNKGANLTQEEIYREAGKLFSRVIDDSQVVDSPFHRAPFLDNPVWNTLFPFRSEPIKSYSMLYRRLSDVRTGADRSRRRFARAATVWFLSNVFASAASALVQTFVRGSGDEEDEELTALDRYLKNFLGDWTSWLPTSMIPVLSDVIDYAVTGWGASRLDTKGVEGLVDVTSEIIKAVNGESKKSPYGLFRDAAEAFSYLSGIPLYAAMRDIAEPAWRLIDPDGRTMNRQSVTANSTDTYDALFEAYMTGDQATVESLTATLLEGTPILSAKDQNTVERELAERLAATNDESLRAALEARRRGDAAELNRQIARFRELGFSTNVITRTLNRMEDTQESMVEYLAGGEEAESTPKDPAMYDSDDLLAAVRNGNLQGATEIRDYLVERSEAKDPVQSVKNALSGEFREEYVEAYISGDLEAARAISGPLKELDVGLDDDDFQGWVRDELADRTDAALAEHDVDQAQACIEQQYAAGREASGMKSVVTSRSKKRVTSMFETEDYVGIEIAWEDLERLEMKNNDGSWGQYYDDFGKVVEWVDGYVEDCVAELAADGDMAGLDALARKLSDFDAFFGVERKVSAYQYVDDLFQSYIDEQEASVWLG